VTIASATMAPSKREGQTSMRVTIAVSFRAPKLGSLAAAS
jgi:hypothetical protein